MHYCKILEQNQRLTLIIVNNFARIKFPYHECESGYKKKSSIPQS